MEFFYEDKKIGTAPLDEAMARRRELQAKVDAGLPKLE
jgi:hypothetical protein